MKTFLAVCLLALIAGCSSGEPNNHGTGNIVRLGSFRGNIVLGSPTATSIRANIFSPDQGGTVYIAYGTTPAIYDKQTTANPLVAEKPLELALEGLTGNTRYYCRLYFQTPGGTGSGPTEEYTYHTARPAGTTFTFCIHGDSHPEREKRSSIYWLIR